MAFAGNRRACGVRLCRLISTVFIDLRHGSFNISILRVSYDWMLAFRIAAASFCV
jgi:hypothetical protein